MVSDRKFTCVFLVAFAHGLVVGPVQVALVGEGVTAGLRVRAGALPTGNVDLQGWVAVVPVEAGFAVRSVGRIPAGVAVASGGIASVSVAVTFARL